MTKGAGKGGSIRLSRISHATPMVPSCSDMAGVAGVYAVAAYGCCAVKIGWTSDISKRIKSLSTSMPFGLELVGMLRDGTVPDEQRIHRELRAYHLRGEWFAWASEVREYIGKHFEGAKADSAAVLCERRDAAVSSLPFFDYEECEAWDAVLANAFWRLPPQLRATLSEWCEGNTVRPMTVEEFAGLIGGKRLEGRSYERVRQIVAHYCRYIKDVAKSKYASDDLKRAAELLGDNRTAETDTRSLAQQKRAISMLQSASV